MPAFRVGVGNLSSRDSLYREKESFKFDVFQKGIHRRRRKNIRLLLEATETISSGAG